MPSQPTQVGPPTPAGGPSDPVPERDRWATSLLVPVVVIALAIGLIGAIVLIAQQQQDEGASVLAAASVDGATLPVTVPYRDVAGAIVIDVAVGAGERTLPMILDTGAPTIVSERIAETYAGDTVGTIATTTVDGQVITSNVVSLPRLSIGGAAFDDVGAVVGQIEPGNPFYCLSDAGFVGANLMRTAVWQVDPQAGLVTIAETTEGLAHVDGATRLELTPASDISPSPLVSLPAGEGTLTTLLDTGSDGWLAAHPDDLESVGLAIPADAPTMAVLGTTATGAAATRARWVDADPGTEVLPFAAMELLPQGQANAGTDYLSRFVVTIDWPAGVVYLDPIAAVAPASPATLSLAWDDGFVVGSYVEGVAANDGLELGAPVLAVDGVDVSGAPFDAFCRHLTDAPDAFQITLAGERATTVPVAPVDDFWAAPY